MDFWRRIKYLPMACVLSVELVVLLDFWSAFWSSKLTVEALALLWAVGTAVIALIGRLSWSRVMKITAGAVGTAALLSLVLFLNWRIFCADASYRDVDSGKNGVYANREIMVIVPHQDDENNLLGGVIEEFIDYGSTVRIVYVTNGDAGGIGPTRLREALEYASFVGIPKENVVFLGYGDYWSGNPGIHLYNGQPGEVMPSQFGSTKTYGLEEHPAFREGTAYTVDNFLSDMAGVILEYRPEVIFCSDYDAHIDHKATTLAFEKAMGIVLKREPEYRPVVMKGFAYNSAWYAEEDYYSLNILSTQNVFAEPYCHEPAVYRWEDAVRFPVDAGSLSRSLICSEAYRALAVHASQQAGTFADSVVNGDRVFWQRRTDSLCIGAKIEATSGSAELLNDFMLIDNRDIWEQEAPYDGVWVPTPGDTERTVRVQLAGTETIHSIVLYDHPSENENILDALIELDDGTQIHTGPLDPGGAASEIRIGKDEIGSFSVTVLETEGDDPGLTEIEAYPTAAQGNIGFGKLMDASGQFAYDYCLQREGRETFTLYTCGIPAVELQGKTDSDAVTVSVSGKEVTVECERGGAGTVSVFTGEGVLLDSIYVRNPGVLERLHMRLAQVTEEFAAFRIRNSALYRIGKRVAKLAG